MTNESEAARMMSVNDAGHDYQLHNVGEGATNVQRILFIKKEPVGGGPGLETVKDGTTSEAVLQVLIHRMRYLNAKLPSPETEACIEHLGIALSCLERRAADRAERGVAGTLNA